MDTLYAPCYYRVEGVFCRDGFLHQGCDIYAPIVVEDRQVSCPACNGLGFLPTNEGKDILKFLEVFARPVLQKMIEEILQERK